MLKVDLITKTCPICGKEFIRNPSDNQMFCSRECGYQSPARLTGKRIPLVTKICLQCNKEFKSERWRNQKFCSTQCGITFHKGITLVEKICPQCNKVFKSEPWKNQKFCSVKCGIDSHRGELRIRRNKSAQLHRTRNRPEYRNKNGKRMTLYRFIMEENLDRELKTGETVHHIDCDIKNNSIENLFLFENESAHIKAHHSIEKLIKPLLKRHIIEFRNGKYEFFGKEIDYKIEGET